MASTQPSRLAAVTLAAGLLASGAHGQTLGALPQAPLSAEQAVLTESVAVSSGPIRGAVRNGDGVITFKGIPYAAPPVGGLRWRSPQPVAPWKDVRDATAFGKMCWSAEPPGIRPPDSAESEDCLTLNVWTAARDRSERRPVIVWIHGGGFEGGSSTDPAIDGAKLAALGAVVVNLNYRLGAFGFLSLPELDAEGSPSGDFGLQDQIAALKWVKENIARFGGDPNNVTLAGESAGAHAVGLLMTSPLARGLFQRAIGESGAFWDSEHGSISTREEGAARGRALMAKLGAGSVEQLRAASAEKIVGASIWDVRLDPGVVAFSPMEDGYVLPESPAKTFAEGRQIDVPLLAGRSRHEEQYIFVPRALPHQTAQAFRDAATKMFGPAHMKAFLTLYPASTDAEAAASAEALAGDLIISEQTWEWIRLHSKTGKSPVYSYFFDYTSPHTPIATHAAELTFVFGTLLPQGLRRDGPAAGPSERALSMQMSRYWVNFAKSGDPNGPGLPSWPDYRSSGAVMRFSQQTAAVPDIGAERLRFLSTFRTDGRLPKGWRSLQLQAQ